MAEIIRLINFNPLNTAEKSKLNADAAASQAVIQAENAQGYATDDYVIVGQLGNEKSELRQISSITNQNITLTANLSFAHKRFEVITKLRGNQIRIYRAVNVTGKPPADASFSILATVNIDPEQLYSEYTDATGGSGYWYKQTYYNSTSTAETPLSNSEAIRGGDYGHYATLWEIRNEAGFQNNDYVTDDIISRFRDNAESLVKGALRAAGYTLPIPTDIPVPGALNNATLLLAAGYLLLQDYGVGYDGTNKEGTQKIDLGNKILEDIRNRNMYLVGIDEVAIPVSDSVAGWPDDTTATAEEADAGGDVLVRISKRF